MLGVICETHPRLTTQTLSVHGARGLQTLFTKLHNIHGIWLTRLLKTGELGDWTVFGAVGGIFDAIFVCSSSFSTSPSSTSFCLSTAASSLRSIWTKCVEFRNQKSPVFMIFFYCFSHEFNAMILRRLCEKWRKTSSKQMENNKLRSMYKYHLIPNLNALNERENKNICVLSHLCTNDILIEVFFYILLYCSFIWHLTVWIWRPCAICSKIRKYEYYSGLNERAVVDTRILFIGISLMPRCRGLFNAIFV